MFKGNLPKYKSNKVVGAMKIKSVVREMDKSATMKLEKGKAFNVPAHIMIAQNPQKGQYYVKYADGAIGFQNADYFKKGYDAIELVKKKTKDENPPSSKK